MLICSREGVKGCLTEFLIFFLQTEILLCETEMYSMSPWADIWPFKAVDKPVRY